MEGSGNLNTAQHIPDSANKHYKTDEFRMYCFKVIPCQKRFSHDWSQCPFAHPTERAKRRDLRSYKYDCIMCPAVEKGEECPLGLNCPHSHNAFESWLHPYKYRTLICKDRENCNRPVCFFAHGSHDIRMPCDPNPPPALMTAAPGHISQVPGTYAAVPEAAASAAGSAGSYRPQVPPGGANDSSMQLQYGGNVGSGYLQGGYGAAPAGLRPAEQVILQPGNRLVTVTAVQQVQQMPVHLQTLQGKLQSDAGSTLPQSGAATQQQHQVYAGQHQQQVGAISVSSTFPQQQEAAFGVASQFQQLQLQQQMRQQQLQHQQQARQLQYEHQLQLQRLQQQQAQQLLPAQQQQQLGQMDAQHLQEQIEQLRLQQSPQAMLQSASSTLPSTGRVSSSFEWSGGHVVTPQRAHSFSTSYELVPSRSLSSNYTGRTSSSFTSHQSASHALLHRMRTASGEGFGTPSVRLSCDLAQGTGEDYGNQVLVLPGQMPNAGNMQQANHLSGLLPQLQEMAADSSWGSQHMVGSGTLQRAGQQTAVPALHQDTLILGSPSDLSPVQQQQQQQLGMGGTLVVQQGLQQQQQQQLLACQGFGTSVSNADAAVSGLLLQS